MLAHRYNGPKFDQKEREIRRLKAELAQIESEKQRPTLFTTSPLIPSIGPTYHLFASMLSPIKQYDPSKLFGMTHTLFRDNPLPPPKPKPKPRPQPRPAPLHPSSLTIPGQPSPSSTPASPLAPLSVPTQSKDKEPMNQFTAHTVTHSSTIDDPTSDSNLAVSDSPTETDTESSVSTSDSKKSYADITKILMVQPDPPTQGQTSHTEPYVDIPSEVEDEMHESSATNHPPSAQTNPSSQKSSNGPWFTFDDLPSHKWRQYRQLQFVDLPEVSSALAVLHDQFLGDPSAVFEAARRDYLNMKCCSLNAKDLDFHYKRMSLLFYKLNGFNEPTLKHVFLASLPDELQPNIQRQLTASNLSLDNISLGKLFQLAKTCLDKLCEQKQFFKELLKDKEPFRNPESPTGSSERNLPPPENSNESNQADVSSARENATMPKIVPTKEKNPSDEPNDETMFALQNSSDSDSDQSQILPSKFQRPIPAIGLIDTSAQRSMLNPHILPSEYWTQSEEHFKAVNGKLFTTSSITKKPIGIQIFPNCVIWTKVIGSTLPNKDILLGFDILHQIKHLQIIPTGIRVKSMFKPFTDILKLYNLSETPQSYQDISTKLLSFYLESHSEFTHPNPLWKNKSFFIKLPFKLNEDINPTKATHPGMSPSDLLLAQQECSQLLAQGLIEPTSSQWACQAFYIEKHSEIVRGKKRLVIDYQPLNMFLQDDKFPLPRRQSMFTFLKNAQIFSKFDLKTGSHDEHRQLLTQFYDILQSHGIMLSAKKSIIATNNIEFLGMVIKDGHYQPGKHIAQELLHFPDQQLSKRQIQQFLGIINYICDFIPHVDHYTHHLLALLKKKPPEWNADHTIAVTTLKQIAQNSTPLKLITDGQRILQTDASDESWGAILLEELNDKEHFIAYASGQFSDTQKHYHRVFKEILAVKNGIKKFEYHLIGHHFLIRMDSSAFPNIFHFKGFTLDPTRDTTEDVLWYVWCLTVLYATKLILPISPTLEHLLNPDNATSLTWTLLEWFSPIPWWRKKLQQLSEIYNLDRMPAPEAQMFTSVFIIHRPCFQHPDTKLFWTQDQVYEWFTAPHIAVIETDIQDVLHNYLCQLNHQPPPLKDISHTSLGPQHDILMIPTPSAISKPKSTGIIIKEERPDYTDFLYQDSQDPWEDFLPLSQHLHQFPQPTMEEPGPSEPGSSSQPSKTDKATQMPSPKSQPSPSKPRYRRDCPYPPCRGPNYAERIPSTPVTLSSTLSLPKSCTSHTANKIENLVEYSYIPECAQVSESSYPLISPYPLYKHPSSFTRNIRTLISTRRPHPKEYIQSSRLDQCSLQATPAEQYVTLEIPSELISNWKREGYTHLHLGGIRLILTLHGRKGLPVTARLAMLDTRFKQYQDAVIAVQTAQEDLPITGFNSQGYPVYPAKHNGHFLWDAPGSGMCDPNCPCWDDWEDDDDYATTRKNKPKKKKPLVPCHHYDPKPPSDPPPPPALLPIYQKELKWIAKHCKSDIPSPLSHPTPIVQPLACMMFSSTSSYYSSSLPPLEPHTDSQRNVVSKPFIPSPITSTGHLEPPKPFESVLNWQTQNARAQNDTLLHLNSKVENISLRTEQIETKVDSITTQMQQIHQNLHSRIGQFDSELRAMLAHRYNGPEFDQKEREIRRLKAELAQIESEKQRPTLFTTFPHIPSIGPTYHPFASMLSPIKHYDPSKLFGMTHTLFKDNPLPPPPKPKPKPRPQPRPAPLHPSSLTIPGQPSPSSTPASPLAPLSVLTQSKDKEPIHQFTTHTVDHCSTTDNQTSDSNLAVSDDPTETDTESSASTSDSEKSYADITKILMVQPDPPTQGQTSHIEPYIDIPSEVEEEMHESSATNHPPPAQTNPSSQKSSNGPWFTFDDFPSHKWRQYRQLQFVDLPEVSSALAVLHDQFLGDLSAVFEAARRDYLNMKCCSLNTKDLDFHYKRMSLLFYKLNGFNEPTLKHVFLASLPDELQPNIQRQLTASNLFLDNISLGKIFQLAKTCLDKLCEQKQFFKELLKDKEPFRSAFEHLQATTDYSPAKDELEFYFSEQYEPNDETVFALQNSSDSDSDQSQVIFHQQLLSLDTTVPIPSIKFQILPSKFQMPIPVIGLIDTGAQRSMLNPHILPSEYWTQSEEHFKAVNGKLFTTSSITKKPIGIQIFPNCVIWTKVIGSTLPNKDILLGFDILHQIKHLQIIPTGIRVKSMFKPFTDILKLYNLSETPQSYQDISTKLLSFYLESHSEFTHPNPLWKNKSFFIKLPFKLNEDINPTKATHPGMSPSDLLLAQQECSQLLAQGLIEPTSSQWACQAFYVEKYFEIVRGKKRLVIDHQPLNMFLQDDKFPLPHRQSSHDEHRQLLTQFYDILQSHGIMLLAKKSTIATNNIEFLGVVIKDGHYQPGKHIAQELLHFPDQQLSKRQIQQFLGIINYIRDFMPHVDHYTHHLLALLKKKPPEWNVDHTIAVTTLKQIAQNPPPLKLITDGQRILQTDASDESWGAILLEELNDKEHFIAYASGQFSDTQKHYHSVFKEILAVKNGIKKFEYHLIGHHFLIRMDSLAFPNIFHFKGFTLDPTRDTTEDVLWYVWCLTVLYATKLILPISPTLEHLLNPDNATSLTWTLLEWFSPIPWWRKKLQQLSEIYNLDRMPAPEAQMFTSVFIIHRPCFQHPDTKLFWTQDQVYEWFTAPHIAVIENDIQDVLHNYLCQLNHQPSPLKDISHTSLGPQHDILMIPTPSAISKPKSTGIIIKEERPDYIDFLYQDSQDPWEDFLPLSQHLHQFPQPTMDEPGPSEPGSSSQHSKTDKATQMPSPKSQPSPSKPGYRIDCPYPPCCGPNCKHPKLSKTFFPKGNPDNPYETESSSEDDYMNLRSP
ncbi:hypothetical protein KPL71_017448 [Citrus sinensis]|uniref:Uncharacterized protein n=1 Tax=Citrus sinensis TaxID=2711 RepID=A0ACB8JQD3_CITSI|nr:hypothetical protein KPL71_017448 [Citrus sinensis]